MYEVDIQNLFNMADKAMSSGDYDIAIKHYLDALELSRKEKGDGGIAEDEWHGKVWFMACNGMGIAYSKWGKMLDAIENFQDALVFAPNKEAQEVAQRNIDKYKKAVKDKLDINIHTY